MSGTAFLRLRKRARCTLVGKHRADVITSKLSTGPKWVSLRALRLTLAEADLTLYEEEIELIGKRFADNRKRVDWRRLFSALDVAPPPDHADPDRSFLDSLPQPYRLIVSVLEAEIVDRAWAVIVERHPELDTSPTDSARVEAEIDLKRSCLPGKRVVEPHPLLPSHGDASVVREDAVSSGADCKCEGSGMSASNGECCEEDESAPTVGIEAVELDARGEVIFTAERCGSIRARLAEDVHAVAGQSTVFPPGMPATMTCISRPIGALRDPLANVGVMIAAAATASAVACEGEAPTSRRSMVAVFRLTVPRTGDKTRSGLASNDKQHGAFFPSFRAVHLVELPEPGASCSLSPDGERLAVSLAGGRVATWLLPPHATQFPSEAGPETADPLIDQHEASSGGREEGSGHSQESGAGINSEADVLAPIRVGSPDFCIPRLPSLNERQHAKALEQLRLRADVKPVPQGSSAECKVGTNLLHPGVSSTAAAPSPLPRTSRVYHAAHVRFVPAMAAEDAIRRGPPKSADGGGIALWRNHSNMWKLYRLPAPPPRDKASPRDGTIGGTTATGTPLAVSGDDAHSRDLAGDHDSFASSAASDLSTLPSAEWLLPSPVTSCEICDWADDGWAAHTGFAAVQNTSGISEERRASSWSTSPDCPPLVAIGTENGGVYLTDAVLATTREGLSRHRARVTALAFHNRRFVVSGSEDEMIHIHNIGDGRGCKLLHCLHYARGNGIVRIACAQNAPLSFVEDTSGRLVVYDLVFSSMMGVLALDYFNEGAPEATTADTKTASLEQGLDGDTKRLRWACAGGHIAVATRVCDVDETSQLQERAFGNHGSLHDGRIRGALSVWTSRDVIWGLSPGLRALAGGERRHAEDDIDRLFFDLGPVGRKKGQQTDVSCPTGAPYTHELSSFISPSMVQPPTPPSAGPRKTAARAPQNPRRRSVNKGLSSEVGPTNGVGVRRKASIRSGESKPVDHQNLCRAHLTEGNVVRLQGGPLGANYDGRHRVGGKGVDTSGRCRGQGNLGGFDRVRSYIENGRDGRAAREARVSEVAQKLLYFL